jgi:predicted permease
MWVTVEGYQPPSGERAASMINAVSPGFFRTLGLPVIAGREFGEREDRSAARAEGWPYSAALVNETFVKRYFAGVNPIGRRLGFGGDPGTPMPMEIVGVVRDARYAGIREEPTAQVFVPYVQATMENVTMYVRTDREPSSLAPIIRREMAALDADLAIYGVATLDDRANQSLIKERVVASLSATLSAMATLLAVVGLYGVMAYLVTRRTREIGIRMALGAISSQIARGVVREAGTLILAGLAAGFAASWWLGRYIRSQLYGVEPADAMTIAAAALTLALVACFAALLPARRAANVSPMAALRED